MIGKVRRHVSMISKTYKRKGVQGAQFSGLIIKNKESSVMPNVHLVFVISFANDQHQIEHIDVLFTTIVEAVSTVGEPGVTITTIFKNENDFKEII